MLSSRELYSAITRPSQLPPQYFFNTIRCSEGSYGRFLTSQRGSPENPSSRTAEQASTWPPTFRIRRNYRVSGSSPKVDNSTFRRLLAPWQERQYGHKKHGPGLPRKPGTAKRLATSEIPIRLGGKKNTDGNRKASNVEGNTQCRVRICAPPVSTLAKKTRRP